MVKDNTEREVSFTTESPRSTRTSRKYNVVQTAKCEACKKEFVEAPVIDNSVTCPHCNHARPA